jgi:rod shape determining protein RodA
VVAIYFVLVLGGWLNIYAAVYDPEQPLGIFNLSLNSGKQLIWIASCVPIILIIVSLDFKFFDSFAYLIYGLVVLLLGLVLVAGREVAGSTSWFDIGGFRMQPSEFAKFATALALAKFASQTHFRLSNTSNLFVAAIIILIPAGLIILQGDTGTALVYGAFVIVLYREGLNPAFLMMGVLAIILFVLTLFIDKVYLLSGIGVAASLFIVFNIRKIKRVFIALFAAAAIGGVVISVDYVLTEVLKPHQQNRIKALINPGADPLGYGWNVTQSKVAIGSGGLTGKGFLNGTQTNLGFVPEQSTDFIFCTLGEEHGWLGSFVLISLFMVLFLRLILLSERQKGRFGRVYGYSVVSLLFVHFLVNVGMTIGLFPVIGIPLPFFSYGGSSLWAFTILLFIFLKIDAHRMQVLER